MFNQYVYSCCFRNHSLFYKPGLVKFHVFQRSIFFNFSLPLHGDETSHLSQCVNVWDFQLYMKTLIDSLVMISMSTSTNADFLLVLKIIQTYCTCLTNKNNIDMCKVVVRIISSHINTNRLRNSVWWNRELTLKCKLKCYVKPMKDPLGVSPNKGNRVTTRGKESWPRWESNPRPPD